MDHLPAPSQDDGLTRVVSVRAGDSRDLDRIKQIYEHYVLNTHATFDLEPLDYQDWQDWFYDGPASGEQLLFVAEDAGRVLGYVKTDPFRHKAAYATSRYTTIYVDATATRTGIGTALYRRLFEEIDALDLHRVYAAIALPNDASVALHKAFGYEHVGTFREVGRKFDRWFDVAQYEKSLG
jgi:phosphinothricin acetyltransferase